MKLHILYLSVPLFYCLKICLCKGKKIGWAKQFIYVYICEHFFVKVPFLEDNLYKPDAVLHQKEDIFNKNWSEFILCDWNQLFGSKVSHTESGDPVKTKDYDYNASVRRKGETFRYRYEVNRYGYEVNGKRFSNILNFVYYDVMQKRVKDWSFEQITYYVQTVERRNSRHSLINNS